MPNLQGIGLRDFLAARLAIRPRGNVFFIHDRGTEPVPCSQESAEYDGLVLVDQDLVLDVLLDGM